MVELAAGSVVRIGDAAAGAWPDDTTSAAELAVAAERAQQVLWGGAYVGDVIRRNAPREYNWADFDEFIREYPDTARLLGDQKELGFCALVMAGEGGDDLANQQDAPGSSTTGRKIASGSMLRARSGLSKGAPNHALHLTSAA